MADSSPNSIPAPSMTLSVDRPWKLARVILQGSIVAYLAAAAVVFLASLFLSAAWLRLPFLGALYDRQLLFTSAAPTGLGLDWDLHRQGVHEGDRLVSLDGQPVRSSREAKGVLSRLLPGGSTQATIIRPDGAQITLDVKLGALDLQDQVAYIILPLVLALLLLAMGIWILVKRWGKTAGRPLVVLLASLSIASSTFFDGFSTHALWSVWVASLAIAAASLLYVVLLFPEIPDLAQRFPLLNWLAGIVAIGALALSIPSFVGAATSPAVISSWKGIIAFAAFSVAVCLLLNSYRSFSAPSPVVKAQARLIAASTFLAFGPLAVWFALHASGGQAFTPYLALPVFLLPLALVYAMQRFSIAGAATWVRRGVIYGALSLLILGAYALIVTGLSLVFGTTMPAASPLWIAGIAFVMALLLDPVRTRLQALADRSLFRGQRAVIETVEGFTNELSTALTLEAISRVVRRAADSMVQPTATHLFVYDLLQDQFAALPDDTGRPSTDIRFGARGPLAQYFAQARLPFLHDEKHLPRALEADQGRLRLLDSRLFLPLTRREQTLGWIALGPRRSAEPYTPSDLNVLEPLAHQASIAISRVQTVENLERRIQEMNALTRVAQGVNITLTFDDVLELIYAQTAQVLPLSHLHITLHNAEEDYYYLAFAVDNNERLSGRENTPLSADVGLAREVVRRSRPILTNDYLGECRAVGASPIADGISAWMGVPLNAGAQSIGALSVGSREFAATYTRSQLELLQAIADQTAGAIVKARLLRATQQRAAQLAKLNDVTRRLASVLDMDQLRQDIVDGAANILGCEAGLLYLLDQSTGELVVRASAGAIPKNTLGQHVPAGAGNASAAAATGSASVQNDLAAGTGAHFLDHGESAFRPRASLAVPLQVQDSIIGVLELMNRVDHSPFLPEDQGLLMAFSGQASVALENVRLYTLTDQELAARVEELSVMQRIDRELNASLEMDRAMRITLEWALRQSNAEAGLIGLLEEGRLRVVVEMGYESAPAVSADQSVALTLPGFQAAVETGQPQRVQLQAAAGGGFLSGADHQVVIPIRREARVIGLLALESTRPAQEDLDFLSRLSDHAAIAISNAQLYDQVQRANIAKSDFVSLVAHELKNPMTSIKGYTELLAAGTVGTVNEMQANFLNTIRSNTDRMSTLVSDLNDNSKIEAGRLRLDFKFVEIMELIEEVIRSSKRQIEEKQQTVQMEIPQQLPPVWGDRTRLGQVFTNLISNANKYTPEGGSLVIGAEPSPNHWDPQGASQVVHVWIRDSGIGISPEDQQRIFQKFFRSEDPKAREAPGAGLGLNITRSLVEMQGGRIWFESQYRRGTTFHFTVPVGEA